MNQAPTFDGGQVDVLRTLQSAVVPMWIFDRETLEILEVNDAAVQEYGYGREQFLRQTIIFLRPPEEAPLILHKTLHGQLAAPSRGETWTHRRANGSSFSVRIDSHWLEWNGRPAELVTATPV